MNAQRMDELWGDRNAGKTIDNVQRGALFRDGNYAMFIHWGLYSQLSNQYKGKTYYGIGEWMMHEGMASMPAEDYIAVAGDFNPVKFDAGTVVRLAKAAGMKYIIITAKHHDGFAMYHTRVSDFNIVDATPFGRDPVKELAEACKKEGIGFGFYYSHNLDWTTPYGTIMPSANIDANTYDSYFKYKCLPQVEEITSNYGPIELVWFDTPGQMSKEHTQQLIDVVRKNQPDAYISGRVGHGLGDYMTLGDMEVPVENIEGLWESVDVTNDAWGYAWYDQNWKSPKEILTRLISTVARGGTYMLNMGPKGDGSIPEQAERSLRRAGEWIRMYPQIVYEADPSPWKHALPWGDVTVKGNQLSLCVYEWPQNGKLFLPGLETEISSVKLRSGSKQQALKYKKERDWVIIELPCTSPDRLISVIEILLKDEPTVNNTLGLDPYFSTDLSVRFGEVSNCRKQMHSWMEKFGEWKQKEQVDQWNDNSTVTWSIDVQKPGEYLAELTYTGEGRLVWAIDNGEGVKIQNQQNSSHLYTSFPIGWLSFDKPGKHTITVTLLEGDKKSVSLASIMLTPIII